MKKIALLVFAFTGTILLNSCQLKQTPPVNPIDSTVTDWKHFILKSEAQAMISEYAKLRKSLIGGTKFQENFMAESEVMQTAQSMLRSMMLQPTCTGIRVYYGVNKEGRIVPIICGIDAKGNDIYWRRKAGEHVAEKTAKDSGGTTAAQATEDEEEGLCDMSTKEPPPITGATGRLNTN